MTPEISPGDRLLMLRLLFRQPHRGDIVVFNTADIVGLPEDQFYVKRVVGEPGEQVRIADGKLYINGAVVTLSNRFGNIEYLPPIGTMIPPHTEMKIPSGAYFVVGDNSTNSYDSRYYGCVPRANIKGRIILCYWPLDKFGRVQ